MHLICAFTCALNLERVFRGGRKVGLREEGKERRALWGRQLRTGVGDVSNARWDGAAGTRER